MPKQQKAHRSDSVGIIRYKIILGEYLRGLRRIMKCKKCKADIPSGSRFCNMCGACVTFCRNLKTAELAAGLFRVSCPAPLVVFSHTIGSFSSSSNTELSAAILNASAPFLPFTLITWHLCGICAPVPICGV